MGKWPIAIRDAFFDGVYELARKDKDIIMLAADCGAPSLDQFRDNLPSQYFTVGIAEQNMISIAAGLALEGKVIYTYAIAPFASLRCYEQVKVDLCCMNLPVTILGVGSGLAYDIMGPTHHAIEDVSIMRALPGMTIFNPSDSALAFALAGITYSLPGPKYVRFDRGELPLIYDGKNTDFSIGLAELRKGKDICIIATGVMVSKAFEVAKELTNHSIDAGVVDLYRLKPINEEALLRIISDYKYLLTLEEHFLTGGMGSAIAELIVDNELDIHLKRIGICNQYYFEYGGRERLHELCDIDKKGVVNKVVRWLSEKGSPAIIRE